MIVQRREGERDQRHSLVLAVHLLRPDMTTRTRLLGLAEAAHALGIPYQQAHRLLLIGALSGTKNGDRWEIKTASVRRLAKSGLAAKLAITREGGRVHEPR